MVLVWIQLELSTQTQLEQVLRSGNVRTLKHADADVWKLEQLAEGKRYTPGAPAENMPRKRGRPEGSTSKDSKKKSRASIATTRPKKSLTLTPRTIRGPLAQRRAELRAATRNDSFFTCWGGNHQESS
jgi:hypothetical protein